MKNCRTARSLWSALALSGLVLGSAASAYAEPPAAPGSQVRPAVPAADQQTVNQDIPSDLATIFASEGSGPVVHDDEPVLRGAPGPCVQPAGNCQAGNAVNAYASNRTQFLQMEDFVPATGGTVTSVCVFGIYLNNVASGTDSFRVRYYTTDPDGTPAAAPFATFTQGGNPPLTVSARFNTGEDIFDRDVYEWSLSHTAINVNAGECYWVEVGNNTGNVPPPGQPQNRAWFWRTADPGNGRHGSIIGAGAPVVVADDLQLCVSRALGDPNSCLVGPPEQPCTQPEQNCQAANVDLALNSSNGFFVADNFSPLANSNITEICFWGGYSSGDPVKDDFQITYYEDDGLGAPGSLVATFSQSGGTLTITGPVATGDTIAGQIPEFAYTADHAAVPVTAGDCYWVEIINNVTGAGWFWEAAQFFDGFAYQDAAGDGYGPGDLVDNDMRFCLQFELSFSGCPSPIPPKTPLNDECFSPTALTFGTPVTGTTLGATDDLGLPPCGTGITAPGVWYSVVGNGRVLTASTCSAATNFDSRLNVYCSDGGDCFSLVCVNGNDDIGLEGCPDQELASEVVWCSETGTTYLILVQGFNGEIGDFEITATSGALCNDASCDGCELNTAGATPEGEACGDDTNGGCNSDPNAFTDIDCGDVILGNTFANEATRDTDWYRFTINQATTVTWEVNAEYPVNALLLDGTCPPTVIAAAPTDPAACGTVSVSADLEAGTYFAFVAVVEFADFPCSAEGTDSQYVARLTCGDAPGCVADFDNSGTVDSNDYFAFLTAFFNGDPSADVDGVPGINSNDYFFFLTAFFEGCP